MAFTKPQREQLAIAFGAYVRAQGWDVGGATQYLLDLVTRARARQKTELALWLAALLAEQQALLTQVDATVAATKASYQAQIDATTAIDVAAVAD